MPFDMLPSILHYPLHLPLLFLQLFPFSNSTNGESGAYLVSLAQSSSLSVLALCMCLGCSSISRLWKRQTFPTPCRPFYSFIYHVIFMPILCNLHRRSFSLRSEPWICEVLYVRFFLTTSFWS